MSVVKLTKGDDFKQKLKDAEGKLVVVDFFAEWCGPCKMIAPKIEMAAKEFTDVLFYKTDVDENDEFAQAQGISAMPTFKFFKNEVEVAEVVGASVDKIRKAITDNK